jgi:hypothetical protein
MSETFMKHRCVKRLNFTYQTMRLLCETAYKRANPSWNWYNLVQNLNETIVKHETYVKPRCTKWLNFWYQPMHLLCEPVYNEWIISETNITLYQT